MFYTKLLETAKEYGIEIYSLMVAYHLDANLENNLSEEDFNKACCFIENVSLKAEETSLDDICRLFNSLIFRQGKSVAEVVEMNKWDFLMKL